MSAWQWNEEHPAPWPDLKGRKGSSTTVSPEIIAAGDDLIQIASSLAQLRGSYLSFVQRAQIAEHLRESYLQLQRTAGHSKDPDLRKKVGDFLVAVGNLGVQELTCGTHEVNRVFTLLEALARGGVSDWVDCYYAGLHWGCEPTPDTDKICYRVSDEVAEDERQISQQLMLWLEEQNLR